MKLKQAFSKKPEEWDARGNEALWNLLFELAIEDDKEYAIGEIILWITRQFNEIVDDAQNIKTDRNDTIGVKRLYTGSGMSSGVVTRDWWDNEGWTQIISNLNG